MVKTGKKTLIVSETRKSKRFECDLDETTRPAKRVNVLYRHFSPVSLVFVCYQYVDNAQRMQEAKLKHFGTGTQLKN